MTPPVVGHIGPPGIPQHHVGHVSAGDVVAALADAFDAGYAALAREIEAGRMTNGKLGDWLSDYEARTAPGGDK